MAFRPVGNGAEAVIMGQYNGQECVTTFGFLGAVDYTQPDLQGLVDRVRDAWLAQCIPQLPQSYLCFEVVGRGLRTQFDAEATAVFTAGQTGSLSGTPQPGNVSLAIARKTGTTGRSRRGRIFWPGFNEADVSGNTISSARADAIVDAMQLFMAAVNLPGDFLLAVISRQENNVALNPGIARPVASWSVVDTNVDSMRRRLNGR